MPRPRSEPVAVITTAPHNNDDDFDRRRRRYAVMMTLRAICVVLAALTYTVSVWLALAFVVGGAVLPWCAVVIANDGPAKRRPKALPLGVRGSAERGLTGSVDRTIDG